jgi:uncharacterized protein (TIGR03437 family)
LSFTATATTTSGANWLSVTPASGSTPGTLQVNLTPGSLDAGTYTGTITVAGTSGASGSSKIAVNLTVTAPLPTITRITNAASGATGSVSPGEFVTIFGTNIAPNDVAVAAFDDGNRLPTTLSGVQVLFNGVLAPLYADQGSGQVTAVVPYSVANRLDTFVQVRFRGSTSNAVTVPLSSTAPGIFSQNFSGTGPGVIANSDNTINSPSNPAAKGSVVVVYATGEGIVQNAAGARPDSGAKIIATTLNDLPRPLLPYAVTVDGQPANVSYFGSISGLAAGIVQINVTIPPAARSGDVPLMVTVGGNSSQTGITVSVR